MKEYREAIAVNPEFAPAHTALGWMSIDKGRLWEAMDFFNRAVKGNPDEAWAYYGIGRVYATRLKREMAAENFSKALRLEKDPDRKNQIMNELFQLGQVGD